jgi:hypothetical protein
MEPGSSRQSQDEADGVTPAGFFCGGRRYQRRRRTRTTASSLGKLGLAYPVVGSRSQARTCRLRTRDASSA